ncbi:MAG: type II secretion system protein [Candidatus Eremiobacteraeota bacterium]|nr:type II secretion system protein [Candidatus Eremiobacteraeota bacterium]
MGWDRRRKARGFTLIELLIMCFILGVLASVLMTNFKIAIIKTRAVACKSNLRNIAMSLQMYYNDSDGFYPSSLNYVTPHYMKLLPRCPAAGLDTYSEGYEIREDCKAFTVNCKGSYHIEYGYKADEPYYTSAGGLFPLK